MAEKDDISLHVTTPNDQGLANDALGDYDDPTAEDGEDDDAVDNSVGICGVRVHSKMEPLLALMLLAGICSTMYALIVFTMWGFLAAAGLTVGSGFSMFQVRQLAIQQKIAAAVQHYKQENLFYADENAKLVRANQKYIELNEVHRQKNEQLAETSSDLLAVKAQLDQTNQNHTKNIEQLQTTSAGIQAIEQEFEKQEEEFRIKTDRLQEQNRKAGETLALIAAGVDNLGRAEQKMREVWGKQLEIIRRELLNNYFQAIDVDRSGYLNPNELKGAHELVALGFNANEVDLDAVDVSGDGKISRSEFVAHAQDVLGPEKVMQRYQDKIDELKIQLKVKGVPLPPRAPEYERLKKMHGWHMHDD